MNKFTYINQDTWLKYRTSGIGASEIPILCGENSFMTPLELWDIKTEKKEREVSESLQKLFDAGHEQEPITLYRFLKSRDKKLADLVLKKHIEKKRIPKKYKCHLFTKFKYNDFMFCHPDMIWNDINIEAKYVKYKGEEWNFDDPSENGVPFKYYIQCQYQMLCTGLKKTILCVNYLGSDHYEFEIEANEELHETFKKLCFDFWQLVQKKEPPMPVSRQDVKKLFPNKNFKSLLLPEEIEIDTIMMKDRYQLLKEKISRMKKEQESIKSSVMSLMTEYNILQTSSGEQIAKITESKSEKIKALKKIKEENEGVYNYLKRKKVIENVETTRFYF